MQENIDETHRIPTNIPYGCVVKRMKHRTMSSEIIIENPLYKEESVAFLMFMVRDCCRKCIEPLCLRSSSHTFAVVL